MLRTALKALARFFPAYEKALTTPFATTPAAVPVGEPQLNFRQLFRQQSERLARTLTEGEPYEAFRLPD